MLEIRNVHKYFNKGKRNEIHVINGTNLEMNHGLVALLGPSGCGKTTLLNAIGGLDNVKKGAIYIDGKKITSRFTYQTDKLRNLKIGYIFQDYKLIENMTVFDNVAIVLKMIGLKDKKEIEHRVCYVLDKVGMLRYRYRTANNLSGGQRQRVGIARAIVKNPDIILADEPTGNLDSKNSLEIMKIISSIARDKLVILVTHERQLAEFFATRIIEIQDGKVIKDYQNEHDDILNYEIENRFYLKDFEKQDVISKDQVDINVYSPANTPLHLDIIVKNGNIYIHSKENQKLQVIDQDSTIELVDDHYKGMNLEEVSEYEFKYDEMITKEYKKKYSAILNPWTLIKQGFVSVSQFSLIKKLMLVGFMLSGMFIMYSVSSMTANLTIKDASFIQNNRHYVNVDVNSMDKIDQISKLEGVEYIVPGDANISVNFPTNDYYQTAGYASSYSARLVYLEYLDPNSIIYGRMPENENEVVVDAFYITDRLFMDDTWTCIGINSPEQMLGRLMQLAEMRNFTIVGISNNVEPCIYVSKAVGEQIFYFHQNSNNYMSTNVGSSYTDLIAKSNCYRNYSELTDYYQIIQGRVPENDYEVMVHISKKESMPINKPTKDLTINNQQLTVVGYYESSFIKDMKLVNEQMMHLLTFTNQRNIAVYTNDSDLVLSQLGDLELSGYNIYQNDKASYQEQIRDYTYTNLMISGVIIAISLIEIYLMIRSSFLSRIKEVGIYRAIGVKRSDIYKMFIGEIIAITTMLSIPGVIFMAYLLDKISAYVGEMFIINPVNIGLTIIAIYLVNLFFGLLPVVNTIRKKPAEILSRYDID